MAKIIITAAIGAMCKFDVYLMNTYIGELKCGETLKTTVEVGSYTIFFKEKRMFGKKADTDFKVDINEKTEIVELRAKFNTNGNFIVSYADDAPHIPMYANSSDVESDTQSARKSSAEQNKLRCLKCGAEIIGGTKFCSQCGQAINQPYIPYVRTQNLKYRNLMTCRSCGAMVAKNAKACPKCGAKTTGQLIGEAVTGIGCGLLSVPIIIALIFICVVIFEMLD